MWNGGLSKHYAIAVNDETATSDLPPTFQPTSPSSLVVGLEKTTFTSTVDMNPPPVTESTSSQKALELKGTTLNGPG